MLRDLEREKRILDKTYYDRMDGYRYRLVKDAENGSGSMKTGGVPSACRAMMPRRRELSRILPQVSIPCLPIRGSSCRRMMWW